MIGETFRWLLTIAIVGSAAALLTACANQPINQITTNLTSVQRGSLYSSIGIIDSANIGPSDCTPPSPVPPPNPMLWWGNVDPTTRANVVVVGFEIWSHTSPSCPNSRQDMYRGQFSFDVTVLSAMSTPTSPIAPLITNATLRLAVQAGLVNKTVAGMGGTSARCPAETAGLASVGRLAPGQILTGLNSVPAPNRVPQFPPVGTSIQFLGGMPVPGTTGVATASVGGAGITIIDITVTDSVKVALNAGRPTVDFTLTGTAETPFSPNGDVQLDCKTFVTPVSLIVTNL